MAISRRDAATLAVLVIGISGLLYASLTAPRVMRTVVTLVPSPTLQELERRYGPHKYTMGPEEWILRELLEDTRGGVFVDIGAADARTMSNTYYLEDALGWSGLAVDAQASYSTDYARYRPRTTFRAVLVSDRSNTVLPFYVARAQVESSSLERQWAEHYSDGSIDEIYVPTITLDALLEREHVERIDLLSMDIEGHEPQALAGFSVARWRPRVVAIEAVPQTRQAILDYFARAGYVLQGRYLDVDQFNLYFRPLP